MNSRVQVILKGTMREEIWKHLLPDDHQAEEAAFAFTKAERTGGIVTLTCCDWLGIAPSGFRYRSDIYLELKDETRAAVIKRAHDLKAGLIELHSHTGSWPASFSPSDLFGLREFVPHLFWRLERRPYAAVVATASGFDGLAWVDDAKHALPLDCIVTEKARFLPTGNTLAIGGVL